MRDSVFLFGVLSLLMMRAPVFVAVSSFQCNKALLKHRFHPTFQKFWAQPLILPHNPELKKCSVGTLHCVLLQIPPIPLALQDHQKFCSLLFPYVDPQPELNKILRSSLELENSLEADHQLVWEGLLLLLLIQSSLPQFCDIFNNMILQFISFIPS